jgi:hypoxia-inducible factor 1 alpha
LLAVLKDEPEDLTHLAPTAGDVDVPLETTCFMSDVFDDLMLSDTYCPLLTEDLNTLSDSQSSHSSSNKGEGSNSSDPFFSYRDETSSSGGSPSSHLHSPALSKVPVYHRFGMKCFEFHVMCPSAVAYCCGQ